MDDLNGLDWSAGSSNTTSKVQVKGTGNYYPSLQPTPPPPSSGYSTPLSAQGSGKANSVPAGANKSSNVDSFANLVSFSSTKSTAKLTLLEQQQKLQAEKSKKQEEQRRQYESQFGNSQFWDGQASNPPSTSSTPFATSRSSTPAVQTIPSSLNAFSMNNNIGAGPSPRDDDDLFAAFNADTKVDKSSHYPPPSAPASRKQTPVHTQPIDLSNPQAWNASSQNSGLETLGNDDDPFGLGQMQNRNAGPVNSPPSSDDDDFLGDLGKPVEEVKRQTKKTPSPPTKLPEVREPAPESDDPWDKAVGELVDMGFTVENSRRALTESGSGLDVQAAVGWLLNDAHRQAKEKSQSRGASKQRPEQATGSSRDASTASMDRSRTDAIPAWMRQEGRDSSRPRREDSQSLGGSDSDVSRAAAAVGSNLLKTANSLWKTSQKKVQKAVADFQQDSDPSQPKWMRAATPDQQQQKFNDGPGVFPEDKPAHRGRNNGNQAVPTPSVTDEALMLEADSRPPPRRTKAVAESRFSPSGPSSPREQSPVLSNQAMGRSSSMPRWQQSAPSTTLDSKSRLSKQAVEEQSAQAYISPARRKKAAAAKPVEDQDILFAETSTARPLSSLRSEVPRSTARDAQPQPPKIQKVSAPITVRPKVPLRNIPDLSSSALASSTQHRLAGTAHFKRGDYASAHASYTSSLSSLPPTHPIVIILLCNRSLTALKTGEPKTAVSDADTAINLIGPGRGESEVIDLQGAGEGKKEMKEFWGKALMRKAEALEQMERWSDARNVWKEAVEAGVGGATAVQGRQRCDKALQPKPKPSAPKPAAKPPARPKPSAMSDLAPPSAPDSEAVNRMRAANAAAEKADDEKFALSDSVDARLSKWRDGRKDNLRALLGGMDQVLWDGSGWKKVGMHELVINSKVKINYMKAIAKVHPDKLPQDASTEMQMISAAVFATLNEAWDKFKTENGM